MTTTTVSYVLAPEHQRRYVYPSSYGVAAGTPVVGGKIYTYESIAKTTLKATYSAPGDGITTPPLNTNPIILDDSGECEIYWVYDTTLSNVQNFYYVEFRDPNDVLIDSYDLYNGVPFPAGGLTGAEEPLNFITNPQFSLNHFLKQTYKLKNQSGGGYNPAITNAGTCYVADDWLWTKSNTSCDETVSIVPFELTQTEVPNNPINYLRWQVLATGSAETYKSIYQFYKGVSTFSNLSVSFQFWGRSSTSESMNLVIRQFFGTGGSPSADAVSESFPIQLTPTWKLYPGTISVPDIAAGTIGTDGNDGVLFEFDLPLNQNTGSTIDITNVNCFQSDTQVNFQYKTVNLQNCETDRDWFGIPVGDLKFNILTSAQVKGWVPMNDLAIGNALSTPSTFASENAYALFYYLWTNTTNGNCPVLPSGRGASALEDFDANKTINLPLSVDRFNLNDSTIGSHGGSTTSSGVGPHVHTLNQNVPISPSGWTSGANSIGGQPTFIAQTSSGSIGNLTQTDSNGADFSILNPYVEFNQFIKL